MKNDKDAAVTYIFDGVVATGGLAINESHDPKTWHFIEASAQLDPDIEGLGVLKVKVSLPIAKASLDDKTFPQLQQQLLEWLPQAIREESLKEWFENQLP